MNERDLAAEIGRRIKKARRDAGLTLKELGERLDWSISRLSNYEQGRRTPGPGEALRLARATNVSPSWLLCLDNAGITDAEREFLAAFRTADPAVQESIERLLSALRRAKS